jgi:hypothetical protein
MDTHDGDGGVLYQESNLRLGTESERHACTGWVAALRPLLLCTTRLLAIKFQTLSGQRPTSDFPWLGSRGGSRVSEAADH